MLIFIRLRSIIAPFLVPERKERRPRSKFASVRTMFSLTFASWLCLLACWPEKPAEAQRRESDAEQISGSSDASLNLVRWSGSIPTAAGRTVEMMFGLYENPSGGLALWTETQYVRVGSDGRYSVLLGAADPEGLPLKLFEGGEVLWV